MYYVILCSSQRIMFVSRMRHNTASMYYVWHNGASTGGASTSTARGIARLLRELALAQAAVVRPIELGGRVPHKREGLRGDPLLRRREVRRRGPRRRRRRTCKPLLDTFPLVILRLRPFFTLCPLVLIRFRPFFLDCAQDGSPILVSGFFFISRFEKGSRAFLRFFFALCFRVGALTRRLLALCGIVRRFLGSGFFLSGFFVGDFLRLRFFGFICRLPLLFRFGMLLVEEGFLFHFFFGQFAHILKRCQFGNLQRVGETCLGPVGAFLAFLFIISIPYIRFFRFLVFFVSLFVLLFLLFLRFFCFFFFFIGFSLWLRAFFRIDDLSACARLQRPTPQLGVVDEEARIGFEPIGVVALLVHRTQPKGCLLRLRHLPVRAEPTHRLLVVRKATAACLVDDEFVADDRGKDVVAEICPILRLDALVLVEGGPLEVLALFAHLACPFTWLLRCRRGCCRRRKWRRRCCHLVRGTATNHCQLLHLRVLPAQLAQLGKKFRLVVGPAH
mmetsp:Transcript_18078/g.30174  ORF Transcript_18078/g.30174 Transcript_18078/m.30174 type:complete len:502 (+) Transcript_18078:106-1611(+)